MLNCVYTGASAGDRRASCVIKFHTGLEGRCMPERMLKFVGTPQALPEKRPPAQRRHDFQEIYTSYAREKAAEQAARCSQCGVPFCQVHCPLHNNIPDWLKLTAEGRLDEAYELS